MGQQTTISYVHHTWNPWRGCAHATLVDGAEHPGCQHCYAEAMSKRNPKVLGVWGRAGTRVVSQDWQSPLRWNELAKVAGKRHRVLVSMCDIFEECSAALVVDHTGSPVHGPHGSPVGLTALRRQFFRLLDATPWLNWLITTKRPQNISRMVALESPVEMPVHNLWLGCSVSTQPDADELVPLLLACRELASVLWVSAEPLLSPITLVEGAKLDWVVVGGESGHHSRECSVQWIRSLARQCQGVGTPCFVKQDSGPKPGQQGHIPDELWSLKEMPGEV